jgi:large subunit ribosomal protein L33
MASKKKSKRKQGPRIKIIMECTEASKEGAPPSRYSTYKNRRNTTSRLELKKYNHFLGRHTLHREIK